LQAQAGDEFSEGVFELAQKSVLLHSMSCSGEFYSCQGPMSLLLTFEWRPRSTAMQRLRKFSAGSPMSAVDPLPSFALPH
jgi:hypothetical protein